MSDINSELRALLTNTPEMESLMLLEKERRNVDKNHLLFVGMANVADYWWCAMRSVLETRRDELLFFESYLVGRLSNAHELGLIDRLPVNSERLLNIGDDISWNDIVHLLKERKAGRIAFPSLLSLDQDGNKVAFINPDFPLQWRTQERMRLESQRVKIGDIDEMPPLLRGKMLEATRSEYYPTICWNFEYPPYVIVGVPDGIAAEFVYEFKTTRSQFLKRFVKPVAQVQADLYGYFFKKDKKRYQIYVMEDGETETFESDIDKSLVEKTLRDFERVDSGWIPPLPVPWKCKKCNDAARQVCEKRIPKKEEIRKKQKEEKKKAKMADRLPKLVGKRKVKREDGLPDLDSEEDVIAFASLVKKLDEQRIAKCPYKHNLNPTCPYCDQCPYLDGQG